MFSSATRALLLAPCLLALGFGPAPTGDGVILTALGPDGPFFISAQEVERGAEAVSDAPIRPVRLDGVLHVRPLGSDDELDEIPAGEDVNLTMSFNPLDELNVPYARLRGRTLTATFTVTGADEQVVEANATLGINGTAIIGLGHVYTAPADAAGGTVRVVGELSISGAACVACSDSGVFPVVE